MKPELQEQLFDKYPDIFRDLTPRHLAVGDGWWAILDCLCWALMRPVVVAENNLQAAQTYLGTAPHWSQWRLEEAERELARAKADVPRASQVKEKFGTLRFYVHAANPTQEALIALAEALSGTTCEECGAPGTTGGEGWILTLCEAHRRDRAESAS